MSRSEDPQVAHPTVGAGDGLGNELFNLQSAARLADGPAYCKLESRATKFPLWLARKLANPPSHGKGVHQWLFKLALSLHRYCSPETIKAMLRNAVAGCGRFVPDSEIHDAAYNSLHVIGQPGGRMKSKANRTSVNKWPGVNQEKRHSIIDAGNFTLASLRDFSPVACDAGSHDAEEFVDLLFPGNPLICAAYDKASFLTRARESFRGKVGHMSLIVPSPMSAMTGPRKKDGKPSAHTLANTGPRHYLVTEFDSGLPDEQAALIWHLRKYAPLTMVLSSGGKSLHAWWNCRDVSEEVVLQFFIYAVTLGADPATWGPSQFVRIPQGWRADKQARQQVYFFNSCGKEDT